MVFIISTSLLNFNPYLKFVFYKKLFFIDNFKILIDNIYDSNIHHFYKL